MAGDETANLEETIHLHEEVLSVGKRAVERGRVHIRIKVREREETVEQDLESQDVEIERVPVGRPVDSIPQPRQDGDVLIVPVVEEELVVTKRLVLKEELHIRKRTTRRTERVTESVRSEEAVITRDAAAPAKTNTPSGLTPQE